MALSDTQTASGRRRFVWLAAAGCLFMVYALLGNYVALPGYLRFLERSGGASAPTGDRLEFIVGATKTIVWMLSFQAGVVCLAFAHAVRRGLPKRALGAGLVVWLAFWSIPSLPRPGAWFYAGFGSLLLVAIGSVLLRAGDAASDARSRTLRLGALVFFAFATWEICGLGSSGRMLHPEEAAKPMASNLLVTQSTKLMLELVIAWSLLGASQRTGRSPR